MSKVSQPARSQFGMLCLAGLRPLLLSLMTFALVLPALAPRVGRAAEPRVDVVDLEGTITPVMARYVGRAIERAEESGAAAVVLTIDTPGGLSSAMDDIVRDILESEVPVVAYVTPRGARAASAGVYIAYAAHVAAMAPGTNIGSASPVFMGGGDSENDETLRRKATNDAVAQIRNLAQLRGRNADWAEQAVRDAVNVTADEAASLGVIDLVAQDVPTLLAEIDGRAVQLAGGSTVIATQGAATEEIGMGWMEQLLQLVADPTVAYLLLSLGTLGIFLELSNPGVYLPGVVGGLCLLLALFGLGTLPVDWTGVLLIAFAFLLFVVDIFVPSFGALTVGGVISFVVGSYLLIGEAAPPGFQIAPVAIWAMTGCLVAFFLFVADSVLRARLWRPYTGRQALVGEVGTVRRPVSAASPGMIYLHGELWRASLDGSVGEGEIPSGASVTVTAVDGLGMLVRPATAAETAAAKPITGTTDWVVNPVGGASGAKAG